MNNSKFNPQGTRSTPFSRRRFLSMSAEFAAIISLGGISSQVHGASKRLTSLSIDPFYLGVASGDPTSDGIVLWTRLSPESLTQANASLDTIEVDYELAADPNFSKIIRTGSIAATPELGHSAHAELRGLDPDTEYFYRWHSGGISSPIGRTKTAAMANDAISEFRFAVASCQQYEHGFYTAYKHMAEEKLDLIVHLGDYIYERSWGDVRVRAHEGPEINSLFDYRARYTTYKSDQDLKLAHQSAPWAVTWDDHEVDNNYASDIAEDDQTPEQLLIRRSNAYQAFYEFMPIRLPIGRQGPSMPIHRRLRFGNLLEMNMLDTRQYRSDQACGDGRKESCAEHQNTTRTLLGRAQKDWLFNSLATSDAKWNVMAQQIMMASLRSIGDNGEELWPMDIWDGYPYERQELLEHLDTVNTNNPIVLTGDIHSNWAADLKLDFDDMSSKTVGSEFIGTSITSGGDGADMTPYGENLLSNNPHVKFYNAQRGYITATVTPTLWQSDYKVIPFITKPDAPLSMRQSYVVEDGNPGVQKV